MLTPNDRNDLKIAMQAALLEESQVVTESVVMENYIKKEVTYEQLLNLCFNPVRDEVYLESYQLEDVARDYILEMIYGDAPETPKPETATGKYELLENIIYEASVSDQIKSLQSQITTAAKKLPELKGDAKEKIQRGIAAAKKKIKTLKKDQSSEKMTGRKEAVKSGAKKLYGAAKEKAKAGYEKGKAGVKVAGAYATQKSKRAADKVGGKLTQMVSKVSKGAAGKMKGHERAIGGAAIGAAGVATAASAWYLYRKLRKQGVEKKKAAQAAAVAAKKKAEKSGTNKDKETAARWASRAKAA